MLQRHRIRQHETLASAAQNIMIQTITKTRPTTRIATTRHQRTTRIHTQTSRRRPLDLTELRTINILLQILRQRNIIHSNLISLTLNTITRRRQLTTPLRHSLLTFQRLNRIRLNQDRNRHVHQQIRLISRQPHRDHHTTDDNNSHNSVGRITPKKVAPIFQLNHYTRNNINRLGSPFNSTEPQRQPT